MNNHSQGILKQRLDKIEKELRWWKRSFLFFLPLIAAFPLMGLVSNQAKVLEAQRIIIRGWNGEVRMVIGDQWINTSAMPEGLSLKTPESLRDASSWGIHLYKSNGKYSSGLVNNPGGGGTLILKDEKSASSIWLATGNGYADLAMSATGQSEKEFEEEQRDKSEKWNAAKTPEEKLKVDSLGRPKDYEARLVLAGNHTKFSLSEKGQLRAVLGQVALENKNGVLEEHPISSLVLFDKNGKVIWRR